MRALHDDHARAVWGYTMRLTGGDRQRAEDVTQETLLRAWRHPDVLQQSREAARAWLFTVARRIVIDGWRSAAARSELVTERPPERATADGTERALQGWVVAEAMVELSREHRDVLALCYFEGCSVSQASLRLGIAEGTVKSRAHYALRALRLALEERGLTW